MKRVIMATGGMDSTVLLYESTLHDKVKPLIVTVDYGHLAFKKQIEMIQHHADRLELDPSRIITINYGDWQKRTPLFTGSGLQDPDADHPTKADRVFSEQRMRYAEMFVEGRNLIMAAYCMAYASSIGADELWAGYLRSPAEWANQRAYKMITGDNSPQFVDAMNTMSFMGFSHQVRMRAPYYERRMSKDDVAELGFLLGVDFSLTHSCYWPDPCGKCDNCILRKKALDNLLLKSTPEKRGTE